MRLTLIVMALLVSVSSLALAGGGDWFDREICRAATKSFFLENSELIDAPDQDDRFGFESENGFTCYCRVQGYQVQFFWFERSGVEQKSRVHRYSIEFNGVLVLWDNIEETFSAE